MWPLWSVGCDPTWIDVQRRSGNFATEMRRLALAILLASTSASGAPPATVVVTFDRHTIHAVLAEGLADRARGRPVSADDPVRIASVSKMVTALGVMRLVDAGKVDLDRDVSDYLGWRLRNPAFPDRNITLRLLLSHQSSITDGNDLYIVPLGTTLRERLADPNVWDRVHPPGSGWFRYTNFNFPVIASVMERVTGERFDRLMQRLVLKPLRLDACFNWSGCSLAKVWRAVVLYRADGEVAKDDLGGTFPPCPVVPTTDGSCDLGDYDLGANGALFSPQGGLRISMHDLARIGQMMARRGKGFLSRRAFAEMTRPAWILDGTNGLGESGEPDGLICAYGLGVQILTEAPAPCRDNLFGDGKVRLGHAGDAYGLKSGLWWSTASGKGLAYFTTEVPDDSRNGHSAFTAREELLVWKASGFTAQDGR